MQGVVTLEDLLEELVGEIYDERDEVPVSIQTIDSNTIALDGAAGRNFESFFSVGAQSEKSTNGVR